MTQKDLDLECADRLEKLVDFMLVNKQPTDSVKRLNYIASLRYAITYLRRPDNE